MPCQLPQPITQWRREAILSTTPHPVASQNTKYTNDAAVSGESCSQHCLWMPKTTLPATLGVALPAALLDPWLSCSVCTCHPELPKHMDSWYPTKLRWIIKNSETLIFQCFWLTGQSNSKLAHEIHQQRKTRPKIIYLSDKREKNVSAPRCCSPKSGIENPGSYHLWKCLSLLRKIFTSVLLYIYTYINQVSKTTN